MKKEYLLKEYYTNYLRNVRKISESSIKHYIGGLSSITKILKEKNKISDSIYEIGDIQELVIIKEFLLCDPDFIVKDSTGHNMYSAALNNYIRFAQGEDFFIEKYAYKDIDLPLKVAELQEFKNYEYKRSSIIKSQVIRAAHFACECDPGHTTFTAKKNNEQYMEGHHIIPLSNQKEFNYSLDVYANIASLCPICHRLLHYGIESEKRELLEALYKDRYIRLCNSGIELTKNDFLELTI